MMQTKAQRKGRLSNRALHERIRADITDLILSGTWGPGHRIPYEHEIMAQYDCARMTVNKAMVGLVEAGLIERRRRAGSFVCQPARQIATMIFSDVALEVAALGATYRYVLLSSERQDCPSERNDFGHSGEMQEVLVLLCQHLANGMPFAVEERLLGLDVIPDAAFAPFETYPPDRWLRENSVWHEIENRLVACAADQERAKLLGLNVGDPVLKIERVHRALGHVHSKATFWFHANLYRPTARFDPSFLHDSLT